MTNQEKAREIAGGLNSPISGYEAGEYDGALEMAEWKDKQLNEELNLISDWFKHIAQMADDKKTLNGAVMKDSDAFDEIKCLAKSSAEYIDMRLLNK